MVACARARAFLPFCTLDQGDTHTYRHKETHTCSLTYTRRNGGVCNTGPEYIIHSHISFCPVATLPRPCRLSSRLLSSFLGSPALPASPRANAAASEHPPNPAPPRRAARAPGVSARHRVLLVPPFARLARPKRDDSSRGQRSGVRGDAAAVAAAAVAAVAAAAVAAEEEGRCESRKEGGE